MIKGTSASCKVVSTKVSKAKAYIKLIISSTKPAEEHKYYRFYIQEDSKLSLVSNNNYWIDRNTNYNNAGNNIDINMYRELLIEVDITAGNGGKMVNNRWVRECQLVLVDEDFDKTPVWYSETLYLVSDEIELPDIQELNIYNTDNFTKLHVELLYKYKSQADFNYNNENLYTKIVLRSNATGKILDEAIIYEEDSFNSRIYHVFEGTFDGYIDVQIRLYNNAGQIVKQFTKLYKAYLRRFKTYVKNNGKAKQVNSIFVGRPDSVALYGIETKLSPVYPPSIIKKEKMVYSIKRNDTDLNIDQHFVDVYVNDFFVTTVHDTEFNLQEYQYLVDPDYAEPDAEPDTEPIEIKMRSFRLLSAEPDDAEPDTDPIKIKLRSFRLLGTYKHYSEVDVIIYDYDNTVHETNFCSDTNVVKF
jgi:hypothetical protein